MPVTLDAGAAACLSRACGMNLSAYRPDHVAERVLLLGRSERASGPAALGLEAAAAHAYRRVT